MTAERLCVGMYICLHVCACAYIYMYVCTHVIVHVCACVCFGVTCVRVWLCVCVWLCAHVFYVYVCFLCMCKRE